MRDILWPSGLEYLLSDPLQKKYADLVKFISSLFSVLNIEHLLEAGNSELRKPSKILLPLAKKKKKKRQVARSLKDPVQAGKRGRQEQICGTHHPRSGKLRLT